MTDSVNVPEGWMASEYQSRPLNVSGTPVTEGDLSLIRTTPRHAVVIETRIARQIVGENRFLIMGPMVRWVGESPVLGRAVQTHADNPTGNTERALREELGRCGELFFLVRSDAGLGRPSVGTMDVNGSRLLHAFTDLQAVIEHHPGEAAGGIPAREVLGWVLQRDELDGLALRCRNTNQAWSGLSRAGVQEVVDSLAAPEVQALIDRVGS